MKKLLPAFLMLIIFMSCAKENSTQRNKPLSTAYFICSGQLAVGTRRAQIASLGIISKDSSVEFCGTSGEGFSSVDDRGDSIRLPIVLPMYDSSAYPGTLLSDGDSLACEIYADTSLRKNFIITMEIFENGGAVLYETNPSAYFLKNKFRFNEGSKYFIKASLQ